MLRKSFFFLVSSLMAGLGARPEAAVILSDNFSYPDGALQIVSSNKWAGHSGTTNQVDVSNGVINLTGAETQDVNAALDGQPYSTAILYCSFKTKFSALPSGSGGYFAHFKDASAGFRGRLWSLTNGAAGGSLRVGIGSASGTAPTAVHTNDLRPGVEYTIVTRLVASNSVASLWINPASENDPNISTEAGVAIPITSYAFRQVTGMGVMTIDNLLVGTTFTDVAPAIVPPPAGASPAIITPPRNQTAVAGGTVTFRAEVQSADTLNYQWQFNGKDLPGATRLLLILTNVAIAQQGDYRLVISNALGTTASVAATLTVIASPTPPFILAQPTNQMVNAGEKASFAVVAGGAEPLIYQWRFNGTNLSGANASTLPLNQVTTSHAGDYQVVVSNVVGFVASDIASLIVTLPPRPSVTPVSHLRTLLDSVNYLPTDTTTVFTVEGIVTTHTNLTSGSDALFHIQDNTAGIAVFWRDGGVSVPQPGDLVRITAPLTHFNGLLELAPNTGNRDHSVTVLSSNNSLPAPALLDFSWQNDPSLMETHEGKLMVVSNVFLDLTLPTFQQGGENVVMTNATGETFTLRIDSRTGLSGRPKPAAAVTIFGVLAQSDSSDPRTSGYQLWPTRFADIWEKAKPPMIRFTNYLSNLIHPGDLQTNTFTEQVLRPGETLTLRIWVSSPDGSEVSLWTYPGTLPSTASWELSAASGTNLAATFTFAPTSAEAGSNYVATFQALSGATAQFNFWKIYVPNPVEQGIIVTEFLGNPTADHAAPHFNPLRRAEPAPNPSSNDEYIEIANLSGTDLDLLNWTISDSVQVRHRFAQSFILSSSNALVVYGGPANGFAPALQVAAILASESAAGLSLNNLGGDSIILRNASGHLISRIVYTALPPDGSLTRYPDANGGFALHPTIAANSVSPGTYPDGRLYGEPIRPTSIPLTVTAFRAADTSLMIQWRAEPGRTYSVFQSSKMTGPFLPLAIGLSFTGQNGHYLEHRTNTSSPRFYRVSVP